MAPPLEALVAEDTKDYFYNGSKPKYLAFEIKSISYSDGYTQAKAIILCEQYLPFPEFEGKPFKVPTPSTWKLVDGQWYWWVDPQQVSQTPFGRMKAGAGAPAAQLAMPKPEDVLMQRAIVGMALDLLETARQPRTTVQAPFQWDASGEWRATYMRIPPHSERSGSST